MSTPKTTRFGAEPLIDSELATKFYVDNTAADRNGFVTCGYLNVSFGIAKLFINLGGGQTQTGAIELDRQNLFSFPCQLDSIWINIRINSLSDDMDWNYRDDGVQIASLTVGAGLTGLFTSSGLGVDIATGSLYCGEIDQSTGTGVTVIVTFGAGYI